MMPIICFCVENTMVYIIAEVAASDSYQSGQWWEFLSWPRFLNVLETRDQFLLVAKSIIGRKLSIQVSFLYVVIWAWWLVPANLQSFMWHCNNCAASISVSYTMSPIDHVMAVMGDKRQGKWNPHILITNNNLVSIISWSFWILNWILAG